MTEKSDKSLSANPPNGTEPEEQPVFDFSRTSYKDMRQVSRLQMLLTHMKKRMDAAPADVDITPMMDELDGLIDRQEAMVMQTVVSLPREWLVTGAPEAIDWQEPDALKWLRSNRFLDVVNASVDAKTAKN